MQFREVIQPIPKAIHKALFGVEPQDTPEALLNAFDAQLKHYGLEDIKEPETVTYLPVPVLDKPLPQWLEDQAYSVYGQYLDYANLATKIEPVIERLNQFSLWAEDINGKFDLPPCPKIKGWSLYKLGEWKKIDYPDTRVLIFDFEAKKQTNGQYLPFMCSALDEQGNWYAWVAPNTNALPKVVTFGNTLRLGIGHNVVGYDRRYVKECYEFNSPIRMLDTLSMYYLTRGMPGEQYTLFKKLKNDDYKPDWCKYTSEGGLDKIAATLGIDMSKQMRDDMQKFSNEELEQNLEEIWLYCAKDTRATLEVYKTLYKEWRTMCPHIISFAGQIERSTLRLNVVKDYWKRLEKVDKAILQVRERRNVILGEALLKSLQQQDELTINRFIDWEQKNYLNRVGKSSAFVKWLDSENVKSKLTSAEKRTLAEKYINLHPENVAKIKRKTSEEWCQHLLKKSKTEKAAIVPARYLSIVGKDTPYFIQMKWLGERLQFNGSTWGIYLETGEFKPLPHPKGEENVGSPLSKDFKARIDLGEFSSDIVVDLTELFENISTVAVWESFRDRFYGVYIYNDTWLTDIIPSGTITERMTGLSVVMPNTKPTRAGTECKHWFGVFEENKVKISADYSGQESFIFACQDDSTRGYAGTSALSCQVLAGNSDYGTDVHTSTAKFLVSLLSEANKLALKTTYCETKDKATDGELASALRQLAKSMNFADQFLCGYGKLGIMIYLAVRGLLPYTECCLFGKAFITANRGEQTKDGYVGGKGSAAFNKLRAECEKPIQTSAILKRQITKPLQARYVDKDFLTTRFNFNIQETGQELVNINLVTVRVLSNMLGIKYNISTLVHDELHFSVENNAPEDIQDFKWVFQLGHLFSKAMLYNALNINCMPAQQQFFESIEVDNTFRKSIKDKGLTPSNPDNPTPEGKAFKAKDCYPSERTLKLIKTYAHTV